MKKKRKNKNNNNKFNKVTIVLIILIALIVLNLYFLYYSSSKNVPRLSTQTGNLTAGVGTFISCTWSNPAVNVSFGTALSPGDIDINATENYASPLIGTKYNVTNDALSNVDVNITIRGKDLVSGINSIGIGNTSWASSTTSENDIGMIASSSIPITDVFDTLNPIAQHEPRGSTVWYRFWLDIPIATVAGTYAGNYRSNFTIIGNPN